MRHSLFISIALHVVLILIFCQRVLLNDDVKNDSIAVNLVSISDVDIGDSKRRLNKNKQAISVNNTAEDRKTVKKVKKKKQPKRNVINTKQVKLKNEKKGQDDVNPSPLKDMSKKDSGKKQVAASKVAQDVPLSITEITAIKSAIMQNWNAAGFSGGNATDMKVKINIKLDIDGNITDTNIEKLSKHNSLYYDAFVQSAVRSVQLISPLSFLPPEKYNVWKEMEFVFDTSGMIQ